MHIGCLREESSTAEEGMEVQEMHCRRRRPVLQCWWCSAAQQKRKVMKASLCREGVGGGETSGYGGKHPARWVPWG